MATIINNGVAASGLNVSLVANDAKQASNNQSELRRALNAGGLVSFVDPGIYYLAADTFTPAPNTTLLLSPGVYFSVGGVIGLPSTLAAIAAQSFQPRQWSPPKVRVVKRMTDATRIVTASSGTAPTFSLDASSPFGRTAYKVAMAAGTTFAEVGYNDLNVPNFNGHVAYRIWVEDYTKINDIKLYVGNSGYALNSFLTDTIITSDAQMFNGERVLYVGPSRINTGGTFVFGSTTLANTKIRFTPNAATNVWVDAIEIPERTNPAVCLTFDDGYRSWLTYLKPLLDRYGMKATFNINTSTIGTNDALYPTSGDIVRLANEGHQITCHNISNLKYIASPYSGDQTLSQYMADYTTARKTLEGYGLPVSGFGYHSYVQGGFDQALIDALRSEGVRCARIASSPKNMIYGSGLGNDIMALRTYELGTNYPVSTVTAGLDTLNTYGGAAIIMGHDTVANTATPTGVQVTAADLEAVLARIAAYGMETLTMNDFYSRIYAVNSLYRNTYAN